MILHILVLLILAPGATFADFTNRNKISSEFTDHISGEAAWKLDINKAKSNKDPAIAEQVFSPSSNDDLANMESSEIESSGIQKRNELEYFNLLEVDYSRPGAKAHQKDVESIVSRTNKKLKDLTEFLRRNGIDCEPIKRSVEIKSPLLIDSEKVPNKEVEYKPHFCEQLLNKYSCSEQLKIHCEKRGVLWQDWQSRTLKVPGRELMASGHNIFYSHHVADSIFEMKLFSSNSPASGFRRISFNSVPGMKLYLAARLKCKVGNIGDDMNFSWEDGVYHLKGKEYVWNTYIIHYQYREGTDICEKWSNEKWEESCSFG